MFWNKKHLWIPLNLINKSQKEMEVGVALDVNQILVQ